MVPFLAWLTSLSPSIQVLRSFCVCKGLAVRRAQQLIFNKIFEDDDAFRNGHMHHLTWDAGRSCVMVAIGTNKPVTMESLCHIPEDVAIVPSKPSGGEEGDSEAAKQDVAAKLKYYQPLLAKEDEYKLMLAQLSLLCTLTDGCFLDAEVKVQGLVSLDVMLGTLRNDAVPYDMRAAMVNMLYEIYIDNSKFEGIPVIDRQYHAYPIADLHAGSPATSGAFKEQQAIKGFVHAYFTKEFAKDATTFMREMERVIVTEDEFDAVHKGHGAFLLSMLRCIDFFLKNSFYRDPQEMGDIYAVITDLLQFQKRVIAEVTNADDTERNKLVAAVLDSALRILELLLKTQSYHTMCAFLEDFYAVYCKTQGDKSHRDSLTPLQQSLVPLCREAQRQAAHKAAINEQIIGAEKHEIAHDVALPDGVSKSICDEYVKNFFHSTNFLVQCGRVREGDKNNNTKTLLVDLLGFPAKVVVRRAIACLKLMYTRFQTLRESVCASRLITDADSMAAHRISLEYGPKIYSLVYDKQIDEKEARQLRGILDTMTGRVLTSSVANPHVQDTLKCMRIVDDVLGVFDQTLDDADLKIDNVTDLQRALADCFSFLTLMTRDNAAVQERMFNEMIGLLENKNTHPPHIAAALARTLCHVFAVPQLRFQVRERHVMLVTTLLCDLYSKGQHVVELVRLLTAMAMPDGQTPMSQTHALIMRQLMQNEANLLQLLQQPIPSGYDARTFYYELMTLLATLCSGETEFIESIAKKTFSVDQLLVAILSESGRNPDALAANLLFLHAAHTNSQRVGALSHPIPIILDGRIWRVVQLCAERLSAFAELSAMAEGDQNLLFNAIAPFLSDLFAKHYKKDVQALAAISRGLEGLQDALKADDVTQRCHGLAPQLARTLTKIVTLGGKSTWLTEARHTTLLSCISSIMCNASFPPGDILKDTFRLIQSARETVGMDKRSLKVKGARHAPKQSGATHVEDYFVNEDIPPPEEFAGFGGIVSSEDVLNACFQQFCKQLFDLNVARNMKFHKCCRDTEKEEAKAQQEWPCPYLEVDEDHTTALPGGYEFQHWVKVFKDEPLRLKRVLTYVLLLSWACVATDRIICRQNFPVSCLSVSWLLCVCVCVCVCLLTSFCTSLSLFLSLSVSPALLPFSLSFSVRITVAATVFTFHTTHNVILDLGGQELTWLTPPDSPLHFLWFRYLTGLERVLTSVNATDMEKEHAADSAHDMLQLLNGVIQTKLCALCDHDPEKDRDNRRKLWKEIHRKQTRLADAGTVRHVLALLGMQEQSHQLFKAAWRLLMALCAGGNPDVQDIIKRELDAMPDSRCLLHVRDELARARGVVLQRRHTAAMTAEHVHDHSEFPASGSLSTRKAEQIKELEEVLGSIQQRNGVAHQPGVRELQSKRLEVTQIERRWLIRLCQGIQLLAEGAFTPLQDHLRTQPNSNVAGVNFVVELCALLQTVCVFVTEGSDWLAVIDQVCQFVNHAWSSNHLHGAGGVGQVEHCSTCRYEGLMKTVCMKD